MTMLVQMVDGDIAVAEMVIIDCVRYAVNQLVRFSFKIVSTSNKSICLISRVTSVFLQLYC